MGKIIKVDSCEKCPFVDKRPSGGLLCKGKDFELWAKYHNKVRIGCPLENYVDSEVIEDKLHKIKSWCNAYPVSIFPEPDLEKMAQVLKDNGMTIDSIGASSMRHVLKGILEIIEEDK